MTQKYLLCDKETKANNYEEGLKHYFIKSELKKATFLN